MAYRRRQYRRSAVQRDKYSVEQTGFSLATASFNQQNGLYQAAVEVVPPDAAQGMRKVKHLTVSVTTTPSTNQDTEFYWALVFVPEGYSPNALFATTGTTSGAMYNPNQFVMNAGVVDPGAGPIRFRSPVSRNLNSGDAVYLVLGLVEQPNPSLTAPVVYGVVRYAVTLQ